jgi:hypothetical protein
LEYLKERPFKQMKQAYNTGTKGMNKKEADEIKVLTLIRCDAHLIARF